MIVYHGDARPQAPNARPNGKPGTEGTSGWNYRDFLEVANVSKTFHGGQGSERTGVVALRDVTFSAAEGTFLSVVGPSGCGKSTLLRLIDGLETPNDGKISLRGEEVRTPGLDRGMVFQSPNLLPWRTVVRNVEFGLESAGLDRAKRRERATELLKRVGLGGFAEFYPQQLSGGMQQRAGLVRALAIDPELLLMDEPFASVDAQTRLELQEELERIWLASGKTVVFITHDIEEALFLSDVVLVMSHSPGRIIEEVEVRAPHPRGYSVRGSSEFTELKAKLLGLLRGETAL